MALTLAVTVSTLLLKVHYLWDVAAGAATGVAFHLVFMRGRARRAKGS
jgi:membrane-associated phospholipid phosphatase